MSTVAAPNDAVELTSRQQADLDLLTQSGLGGVFFAISAVTILLLEPLIWTQVWLAIVFLMLLIGLMLARLRFYIALRKRIPFLLPGLYRFCLLGNAVIWGVFGAWVLSLPSALNASSVLVIATTAGSASGGALSMAMDLKLSRALVLLYFSPMILFSLWHVADIHYLALGFLLTLFISYLHNLSGKQHSAYWKMLEVTQQLRQQTYALEEARNQALQTNISLQQARNEAVAAGNAKTEFLTHMSHEMRTPLNGVIGMADLLATTELTAEQSGQVGTILESGKLVLGLINDVLSFTQINSGQINLIASDVNLKQLAESTLRMLEPLAEPKANQLIFIDELQGDYWAKVDRVRLQQLFINLLSNANKFSEHGKIELKLSRLENTQVGSTILRCEVQDEGIGIEEEYKQHIFDSFFQIKKLETQGRGTGLGLAICQKLVQIMEGTIGVESELNKGSCFWFEIPFVVGTPKNEEAQMVLTDQVSVKKMSPVLVVEDNLVNQKVMSAFLNKLQYPHVIVASGEEALTFFRECKPSIILMDCNLPDISGMEATKQIRQIEKQQNLPAASVIAVTAFAFSHIMEDCLAAGMNDHIAKPVTLRVLQNTLEKLCS